MQISNASLADGFQFKTFLMLPITTARISPLSTSSSTTSGTFVSVYAAEYVIS